MHAFDMVLHFIIRIGCQCLIYNETKGNEIFFNTNVMK